MNTENFMSSFFIFQNVGKFPAELGVQEKIPFGLWNQHYFFFILFYSFHFNFKCFMCLIFTTIFPFSLLSFNVFVSVWYAAAKHHPHCGRRKIARSETEIWAVSECELIYGISYFFLSFHVRESYPGNLCLLLVL